MTAVNTPRLQALLAYLVLHRGVPQSRKHLAFLFWPDTNEAQALTNLRNLLHKLRQTLPDSDRFFSADMHAIYWRVDTPCTLDVAEFELLAQSTTRSDLEQAANLYRGELLPSCYDDWIVSGREDHQQRAARVLERLIAVLEAEGDYKSAIGYGRRLRQLDPLNEDTHRTIMRLHAANQDRASVLRAYHTCVKTLQDEFGADPAPETRELYEGLMRNTTAPPWWVGAAQSQPHLVGRQREWQTLQAMWRATSSGKPGCVLLTGEAGIGKTRLAEELITWARRQGFIAAAARCYAAEGALAYAPVVAWLRSPVLRQRLSALEPVWATEAARLLPELLTERPGLVHPGPVGEDNQRQRLFEAMARAMLERGKPLLLLIDDLQWCDRDTLEWLHFLLRFDPRAQLLILGTLRDEDTADNQALGSLLSVLHRDGQLTEIPLAPLSAEETTALAIRMSDQALTPEQLTALYRETEGNPLFLIETMRFGLATSAQSAQASEGQASRPSVSGSPLPLPPRVHGVLHARLLQLSAPARELAGLAAAIGREFTLPVLARVSDQNEDALVRSLDELWQRGIVRDASSQRVDAYDFTHDKLREVAYDSLSAARRRLLHRRIAQALEAEYAHALDTVSAQVATHYELARRFEQASLYYERAADMARRVYANADAIGHYRRALALLEGPTEFPESAPTRFSGLYEALGDVLDWTGQYDEARTFFERALACVSDLDPINRGRLHRKAGNTWREQYRYEEALHTYVAAEQALGEAPGGEDSVIDGAWWQESIQISLEVILVHYWLKKLEESDSLRPKLQAIVEQHGSATQRANYAQNINRLEFRRNRHRATAETVALSRAALAAHQEAGNPDGIRHAQFEVGFYLLWSSDPMGALEPIQLAFELVEPTGNTILQARYLTYLAVAHRQCGQVEETRRCVGRALRLALAAHMPEYVGTAKANQAWLAWLAGDLSQARELGHAALVAWQQLPTGHGSTCFQWVALWPLIAIALHDQQLSQAIDHARALLDPDQQRLPDALAANLEQAIQAWDGGTPKSARVFLHQSMALAQQMHYL